MAISFLTPAVVAGAVAAAIALAPAAGAEEVDDLEKSGSARGSSQKAESPQKADPVNRGPNASKPTTRGAVSEVPKGWTNEAQWARPGAGNNFGSLPKPPAFALD
jgi:hypothetical protein